MTVRVFLEHRMNEEYHKYNEQFKLLSREFQDTILEIIEKKDSRTLDDIIQTLINSEMNKAAEKNRSFLANNIFTDYLIMMIKFKQ